MKDRPVVLVYQHFFPDFSAGGPVTSIGNLAKALGTSSDVRVIASNRIYSTGEPMTDVTPNKWTSWNGIAVWYASDRASVRTAINGLPADSVLYLNGLFLIDYFLVPLRIAARRKLQVIISPRGMLQQGALRSGSLKKKLFLRMLTSVWLTGREQWHATDDEERHDIEKRIRRRGLVTTIPNLPRPPLEKPAPLLKKPGEVKLIYYSLISRKKNLKFLLDLLKSPALTHVTLHIAGPIKDAAYWDECQAQISKLPDPQSVRYIGEQNPVNIPSLLAQYHLFVLPTEGENFGHSIVEALGCGRPVLISNHTPWKDVGKSGAGFSLALDKDSWVKCIIDILQWDQQKFERTTFAALGYFADKIDMNNLVQRYGELFQKAGA
jgi:glycosyltransferase involved in cell wall biosynthesis